MMKHKVGKRLMAVIAALMTLALLSTAVFAEGELPPEPEAPAEAPAPEAASVPGEAPAAQPKPATDAAPNEEPVTAPDEAGGSFEVTAEGDPWWMVGAQKYAVVTNLANCPDGTSAGTTCWQSATPITEAFNRIDDGLLPTDRKLYVEAGEYPGFTLDGSNSYYGWQMRGVIGSGSGEVTLTSGVSITNNYGGFTLSGMTINGLVLFENTSSGNLVLKDLAISNPYGEGIQIHDIWYHCINPSGCMTNPWEDPGDWEERNGPKWGGTITLDNVRSNNNDGAGALIYATGTVNITSSTFNDNNHGNVEAVDNLTIIGSDDQYWKPANVNLNGVTANNNFGGGIWINAKRATIKNVIANGNFLGSYVPPEGYVFGYGLVVWTETSPALLENVSANDNEDVGINLNHYGVGNYTLKNVEAVRNSGGGIWLHNEGGGALLTNISVEDNGFIGLDAQVKTLITINTIYANRNGGTGIEINGVEYGYYDEGLDEWVVTGKANPKVTIGNALYPAVPNIINGNAWGGISINTTGAVVIANVSVDGNTDEGIRVDNCYWDYSQEPEEWVCAGAGAVTIKSTLPGTGNWVGNNNVGIYVASKGTVAIDNTIAESNHGGHGIEVYATGKVTLKNVSANFNAGSGAYIDNCLNDGSPSGACTGFGAVAVSASSGKLASFDENGQYGLYIRSRGLVTLQNISANRNNDDGVTVKNNFLNSVANVTVSTLGSVTNQFNDNGQTFDDGGNNGLTILSMGNISLTNVVANSNQNDGGGVCLVNSAPVTPKTVTITNVVADNNEWNGIYVHSKGNITLKNAQASNNGNEGAVLNNHVDGFFGNITVGTLPGGANIFNDNNGTGLLVDTYGIANVSNVTAKNNFLMQNYLDWYMDESNSGSMRDYYNNDRGADTWTFNMEGGTYYSIKLDEHNENPFGYDPVLKLYDEGHNLIASSDDEGIGNGAWIEFTPGSDGTYYLEVSSFSAADGYYYLSINRADPFSDYFGYESAGVWIQAQKGTVVGGSNDLSFNSASGLSASGEGNILVGGHMQAIYNGVDGLSLYSWNLGNTTVTGTSLVAGNNWHGALIQSDGNISVSNMAAWSNGMDGLAMDAWTNLKTITLKNIDAQYNGQLTGVGNGIWAAGYGKITLNNVKAWFNKTDGAYLESHNNPVTVTLSSFMCNEEDGLDVNHGSGLLVTLGNIYVSNGNRDFVEY